MNEHMDINNNNNNTSSLLLDQMDLETLEKTLSSQLLAENADSQNDLASVAADKTNNCTDCIEKEENANVEGDPESHNKIAYDQQNDSVLLTQDEEAICTSVSDTTPNKHLIIDIDCESVQNTDEVENIQVDSAQVHPQPHVTQESDPVDILNLSANVESKVNVNVSVIDNTAYISNNSYSIIEGKTSSYSPSQTTSQADNFLNFISNNSGVESKESNQACAAPSPSETEINSKVEINSKPSKYKPVKLISELKKADKKIHLDDYIQDEFLISCKTHASATNPQGQTEPTQSLRSVACQCDEINGQRLRLRHIIVTEMVQVTSKFTYHDIVDTSGHVLKTELVSKHLSEDILSKTTDTKINYNDLNMTDTMANSETCNETLRSRLKMTVEPSVETEPPVKTTQSIKSRVQKTDDKKEFKRKTELDKIFKKRRKAKRVYSLKKASNSANKVSIKTGPVADKLPSINSKRSIEAISRPLKLKNPKNNHKAKTTKPKQPVDSTSSDRDSCDFLMETNFFSNFEIGNYESSESQSSTVQQYTVNTQSTLRNCTVRLEKYDLSSLKFPIKLTDWHRFSTTSMQSNTTVQTKRKSKRSSTRKSKKVGIKRNTDDVPTYNDGDSIILLNPEDVHADSFDQDDEYDGEDVFLKNHMDDTSAYEKDLQKNSLVFAKWSDMQYYPARVLYKDTYNNLNTVQFISDSTIAKRDAKELVRLTDLKPELPIMLLNTSKEYEKALFIKTDGKCTFHLMNQDGKIVCASIEKVMLPSEFFKNVNKKILPSISYENLVEGKRKRKTNQIFKISNQNSNGRKKAKRLSLSY